jgi:hypothetical protein
MERFHICWTGRSHGNEEKLIVEPPENKSGTVNSVMVTQVDQQTVEGLLVCVAC